MNHRLPQCLFILAIVFATFEVTTQSSAEDWLRFRGPNGSGISGDAVATPATWSPTENLKWKAELPGAGVSCPVVVGDKIFVTCYSGYGMSREEPGNQEDLKRHVVCINRDDGSVRWKKTIEPFLPEDKYAGAGVPAHGYASHTPVSDGEHLFVFLGKSGVLAFDFEGNQLWSTSVGTGSDQREWGSSCSPVAYKDVLIVPAIAEGRKIYGINKKNGEVIWTQDNGGISSTWGSPILVKVGNDRTDLVFGVPEQIIGLNPLDGTIRWYCNGVPSDSFYSSVIENDGVIYAAVGSMRGGGSIAVKAGGEGDVTDTHVVWTGNDRNSYGTPVAYEDSLFLVSRNILTTIDLETGKKTNQVRVGEATTPQSNSSRGNDQCGGQKKQEGERTERGSRDRSGGAGNSRRRGRRGGGVFGGDYASPVVADDKLYFVKRNGETWVFSTEAEPGQIAINKVTEDSEEFSATPAISNGQIFLRSNRFLYCVESDK